MRTVYLAGWFVTRFAFLCLWLFTQPVGELNVWMKEKYLAA